MSSFIARTDEYTRLEEGMVNTIVADVFSEEGRGDYVKVSPDILDMVLTETGWTKSPPRASEE